MGVISCVSGAAVWNWKCTADGGSQDDNDCGPACPLNLPHIVGSIQPPIYTSSGHDGARQ